jgi:DNA-binding IclR family transcriptional regulator
MNILAWWQRRRTQEHRRAVEIRVANVIGAMLSSGHEDNYIPDLCKVTNMGPANMRTTLAHMQRAGLVRSGVADDGREYWVLTQTALQWVRDAAEGLG